MAKLSTNKYWENVIDAMIEFKSKNTELILKYLKTAMNYEDAKKIFPKFIGKYLD